MAELEVSKNITLEKGESHVILSLFALLAKVRVCGFYFGAFRRAVLGVRAT